MSYVSTVVIVMGMEDEEDRMAEVQAFEWPDGLTRRASFTKGVDPCGEFVGGTKCAEADVWIAAFNYLPVEDFLDHLETVKWRHPEQVVAIIHTNFGDGFEVWRPNV